MDEMAATDRVPVTMASCSHVRGPFFHGTRFALGPGTELVAGRGSNYHEGRVSNHLYFSAAVATAAWGAQLATALAGMQTRGHIYVVRPSGPFEDDPNVTDKRFPGNPTQSYRTTDPLLVVEELRDWEGHSPEAVDAMVESIRRLREQGLDVIDD